MPVSLPLSFDAYLVPLFGIIEDSETVSLVA